LRSVETALRLIIVVTVSVFSRINENGNCITTTSLKNGLKKDYRHCKIPPASLNYDTVRALSEFNEDAIAEAYPWISRDGLRLYFNKNFKIVYSERADIYSTFSEYQVLSINSPVYENLSCWLTGDELDIYFMMRVDNGTMSTTLYHANRSSVHEEFLSPVKVNLTGDISGFLTGPSLTPDFSHLYLWNSIIVNNRYVNNIYLFNKTGENAYTLADSLEIPDGLLASSGSLSPDNLKYYFALEDSLEHKWIYYFQRSTVTEKFKDLYYIDNSLINEPLTRNGQPSVSYNGYCMIFTRSEEDFWEFNDLYIAFNKTVNVGNRNNKTNRISINNFPNPFSHSTVISFNLSNMDNAVLAIYNLQGELVEIYDNLNGNFVEWDATGNNAGTYIAKLILKSETITRKLIYMK
jgi:hypothetical protein